MVCHLPWELSLSRAAWGPVASVETWKTRAWPEASLNQGAEPISLEIHSGEWALGKLQDLPSSSASVCGQCQRSLCLLKTVVFPTTQGWGDALKKMTSLRGRKCRAVPENQEALHSGWSRSNLKARSPGGSARVLDLWRHLNLKNQGFAPFCPVTWAQALPP